METTRISSEEKESISIYVGVIVAIILAAVAIYFVFVAMQAKKEVTGFDPNRPVPTDAVLKRRIKPEEFFVVREGGMQTPFQNQFWNNVRVGLYVDVITGEPLFTSLDKFDNGFGMPTFSKPITPDILVESQETTPHGLQRTRIRAKRSNAYLGYLFPDPKSPTGKGYSCSSAAFRFIPIEQMKEAGYEAYLPLLERK